MEKIVDVVMRHERQSDLLDRMVLAIGVLSLCLALAGTVLIERGTVAQDIVATESAAV